VYQMPERSSSAELTYEQYKDRVYPGVSFLAGAWV
jgi:hypothetical protein